MALLAREVAAHAARLAGEPVAPRVGPRAVRDHLARYDFARPLPLADLALDAARMLRRWTTAAAHPRHFGMFNPGAGLASVLGDALAALYNPQLAAWEMAPAAVEVERHVLAALAARLGYDPATTAATFTSGGAESNLTALVLALARAAPGYAAEGVRAAAGRPTVYLSEEGHPSVVKAALVAGLGRDAVATVPCAPRTWRMDVGALADRLARDAAAGALPVMVVATVGTTGAGAIDPLADLADVAARHGAWLHADAAWGALATLSPRLAPHVAGLARADSVAWDAHKSLGVAQGAGMFFTRHPAAAPAAFAVEAPYMPRPSPGRAQPYATTLQWSRRFAGLKVFLALAERGFAGYAAAVDRQCALADRLRAGLAAAGFRVLNATPLPLVCFTHAALDDGRTTPRAVVAALARADVAWLAETRLAGRVPALRACVTSERTDARDVDALVAGLARAVG